MRPIRFHQLGERDVFAPHTVPPEQVDRRGRIEALDVAVAVATASRRLQVGQREPAGDERGRAPDPLGQAGQQTAEQRILDLAEAARAVAILPLDPLQPVEHQQVRSAHGDRVA